MLTLLATLSLCFAADPASEVATEAGAEKAEESPAAEDAAAPLGDTLEAPSNGGEGGGPEIPVSEEIDVIGEVSEEITVYGDLFARWDNTRWLIATEVVTPFPLIFSRDANTSFRSQAFQTYLTIECNKDWKLGRRKFEVSCVLQDFSMRAAVDPGDLKQKGNTQKYWDKFDERLGKVQAVLDEIDAKLTGAALQLQVTDNGRVTGIDLEGVSKDNRRESLMHETLRQVLRRAVVGFDMRLRKWNQLHEGKWHEYNPAVLSLPVPPYLRDGGGSSVMVHYLNRFEGQTLIQSIGEGLSTLETADGIPVSYKTKIIGVSIFDVEQGYMIERVFAVEGESTSGAMFSKGQFWHAGRINMLDEVDQPDLGETMIVNEPKGLHPRLPEWISIER